MMNVSLTKDLELNIHKEHSNTLHLALAKIEHTHNIDVAQSGNYLIISGDNFDILTLLYYLTFSDEIILE
jgi:hypothetical protein